MDEKIEQLSRLLKESKYTVVFTGAGMSTESNLPDFRSAQGLWSKFDPYKLATTEAMRNNREEFKEFYSLRMKDLLKTEPHQGHYLLADWEQKGVIQSIITQNVDGFHQRAGSEKVAELHGTLRHSHCHRCGAIHSNEAFLSGDDQCNCGGLLRPSVVLFGESLPDEELEMAQLETDRAEVFIVLGSSLQVSPANYYPSLAKRNGAKLVIVNMEETPLDGRADLLIHHRKIGEVLKEVVI